MSVKPRIGISRLQVAAMNVAAAVLLLAAVLADPAQAAQRVALVIGNGDYGRFAELRNPANDARAMAEKLRSVGFKLVGDKAHVDVKHRRMARLLRDLQNLLSRSGPAATALVYYSGHGVAQDGTNWLVPVDDGEIRYREDVPDFAIGAQSVLRRLKGRAGGLNILFLDACRNNPLLSRHGTKGGQTKGLTRTKDAPPSTVIVYAAAEGKVAYDGDGNLSPFTGALIEHMGTSGKTLDQVLGATAEAVRQQTEGKPKGPQEVWVEKQPHKDAFYFVPGKTAGLAVPSQPQGDSGVSRDRLAARAYEAAERLNTVEAFETVISGFPNSPFAALARGHIRKLRGAGTQTMPAPATPEPDPPETAEAALGLQQADRRLIQAGLASLGFDPGPADGVFGERTRLALKAWQTKTGEAATGRLTPASASTLKAEGRKAMSSGAARPVKPFQDCGECPEMVVLPAGSFDMGSPPGEEGWDKDEGPQHRVKIRQRFAVSRYEVTFAEWDACVSAGGCNHRPSDEGWGRDRRPVVNVSWEDAKQYVGWLSRKTGRSYRLLSESEWEYAARAGTRTRYHWGDSIRHNRANCDGCGSRWDNEKTAPVGSFAANRFRLHDLLGNVWEWVEDCWHGSYGGAPSDGSAWTTGGNCSLRMLRGGSWNFEPGNLRAAGRLRNSAGDRNGNDGFRVARTLAPLNLFLFTSWGSRGRQPPGGFILRTMSRGDVDRLRLGNGP